QLGGHAFHVVEQISGVRHAEETQKDPRPHRQSLPQPIVEARPASYFPAMAFLMVGKILDSAPGVKKDGNTYNIPEEVDATAFVAIGQEVLQLPRVAKVEITADAVRLATHKGEVFFFPP